MPITNIAKVTSWNDEKGFGFAEVNGKKHFVHINALGRVVRSPKIGDSIIVMEFMDTQKGPRIVRGVLDGVPLKPEYENHHSHTSEYYRKRKLKAAAVVALLAIPVTLFSYCQNSLSMNSKSSLSHQTTESAAEQNVRQENFHNNDSRFSCDGRTHCSQMTSYEEAVYFLNHCPGTQMDGDGDGIPCERQFGR